LTWSLHLLVYGAAQNHSSACALIALQCAAIKQQGKSTSFHRLHTVRLPRTGGKAGSS